MTGCIIFSIVFLQRRSPSLLALSFLYLSFNSVNMMYEFYVGSHHITTSYYNPLVLHSKFPLCLLPLPMNVYKNAKRLV